jgi:L-asparaginase
MLIDSLDMTDHHRQQLAQKIAQTPESKIVVLHGTDTMAQSAKTVMLHRKEHQTIVFAGAMVPASLEQSDALFNFGFACAAAQFLQAGTYIAMNGKVFPADRAQKNTAAGRFEEWPEQPA